MNDTPAFTAQDAIDINRLLNDARRRSNRDMTVETVMLHGSRGRGTHTAESDFDVMFVYSVDSISPRKTLRVKSADGRIDAQGFEKLEFRDRILQLDAHIWEGLLNTPLDGSWIRDDVIDCIDSETYFLLLKNLSGGGAHFTYAKPKWRPSTSILPTVYEITSELPTKEEATKITQARNMLNFAEMAEFLFLYVNKPLKELLSVLQNGNRSQFNEMLGARHHEYNAARLALKDEAHVKSFPDDRAKRINAVMGQFRVQQQNILKCAGGILAQANLRHMQARQRMAVSYHPDKPDEMINMEEHLVTDFVVNIHRVFS